MYCPCKTDEADEIFVCSIRSNVEVSHTPAIVPVKVYIIYLQPTSQMENSVHYFCHSLTYF